MPIEKDAFRSLMRQFAAGVTVVTTQDETGARAGLTVTAFSSVSMEPPLALVCLDKRTASLDMFRKTRIMGINMLSAAQEDVSNRFATRVADKFISDDAWIGGPQLGCPVLDSALAWMECRIEQFVTAGDHDILIGHIESCHAGSGHPLVYWNGGYRTLATPVS